MPSLFFRWWSKSLPWEWVEITISIPIEPRKKTDFPLNPGCLMEILTMVYYHPHIIVKYIFHCSITKCLPCSDVGDRSAQTINFHPHLSPQIPGLGTLRVRSSRIFSLRNVRMLVRSWCRSVEEMMRWMFFGKTAAVMAQILMLILSLDGTPGSRCSPTIFQKRKWWNSYFFPWWQVPY